jgi:hypothetical protein
VFHSAAVLKPFIIARARRREPIPAPILTAHIGKRRRKKQMRKKKQKIFSGILKILGERKIR